MTFIAWTLGAFFLISVASSSLHILGWRALLGLTCLPSWIGLAGLFLAHESPRFLVMSGRGEEAREVLQKMANANNRELTITNIKSDSRSSVQNQGQIKDLFRKDTIVLTISVCFIWFVGGFSYYGAVLLSSELPLVTYPCLQNPKTYFVAHASEDTSCCTHLDAYYFITQAVAACGDLLGSLGVVFLPELMGRKPTLYSSAFLSTICFFCLSFCMSIQARSALLLLLRCWVFIFFNVMFVYSPEAFPTSIRSTATGFGSSCARIGGVVTPFVSQVTSKVTAIE